MAFNDLSGEMQCLGIQSRDWEEKLIIELEGKEGFEERGEEDIIPGDEELFEDLDTINLSPEALEARDRLLDEKQLDELVGKYGRSHGPTATPYRRMK